MSITAPPQARGVAASASDSPVVLPTDIPRRPSPWHDIAHSLSTTSLPPSSSLRDPASSIPTPPSSDPSTPPLNPPVLSASQALREWEERLSQPDSDVTRHQLVHPQRSPTPKLAAERDKVGFIEYKLKLIEPTAERFERLVTQMMWRLKQGKNEAIYELGLADDGTVIGLTRSEMDASLRTLELMASEVGATVIVLKEIVLSAALPPSMRTNGTTSLTSSIMSTTDRAWAARRPDLDENGLPRKGNKSLSLKGSDTELKGRRARKELRRLQETNEESQGVEPAMEKSGVAELVGDESDEDGGRSPRSRMHSLSSAASASSDNDSPFLFDPDDPLPSPPPAPKSPETVRRPPRTRGPRLPPTPPPAVAAALANKESKKRRKSMAKQEQRRLDLLRGDGTNPMWAEMAPLSATLSSNPSHFALPHQPVRPSSLRLATPADAPDDSSFMDDLLHIPLDSLSLSFADVHTVSGDAPSSGQPSPTASTSLSAAASDTELALPLDDDALLAGKVVPPPVGDEMICVEALVVRKVQHDHGGDEDGDGEDGSGEDDDVEDEEWAYGGEEDVWGFGGDED
ncbi:hypothetical protein IAT38_006947 [Cryptococcus sp. DSM 104549]